MATTASLAAIDWLLRTYAVNLLTRCGQASLGSTLAGSQAITTTGRLSTIVARYVTAEGTVKGLEAASWMDTWGPASDLVFNEIVAGLPAPSTISTLLADPDANVKVALKVACRTLEMSACKFEAEGGVL